MMLPAVTLQLTAMLAESPVLMNPTAVKSAVAFWRRVRILGETSRSAIALPGSVARTGNSHATIAAVTRPARDARTTRSFSRARRDDSLCLNVMGLAPSWVCASRIEELAHVGRRGRSAGEDVHAEAFENDRNVLGCWYVVVDWYPRFDLGLIASQYTRPPPSVLSPPDSSNTMINRPSCWNTGLATSGAMLVCSQLSAVLKEQSCASLHRLGTMFENVGSVPFAKSVANCVKGTLLHPCPVASF